MLLLGRKVLPPVAPGCARDLLQVGHPLLHALLQLPLAVPAQSAPVFCHLTADGGNGLLQVRQGVHLPDWGGGGLLPACWPYLCRMNSKLLGLVVAVDGH